MTSTIKVDTISENTSANGVAVDGVTIKDGNVGAAGTATSVAGIPFFQGDTGSIYTHDVSGTDDTAQYNTAYGLIALDAITTGDYNTTLGYAAGTDMTTGNSNNLIGYLAGENIVDGAHNTFIGRQAGRGTTSASAQIFIGGSAGEANTTGGGNIAIGYSALDNSDTESNNLAIGEDALGGAINGGEYNVAIGKSSLDALTSGDETTCVGYNAGTDITTGTRNTFMGYQAGKNNVSGNYNVAVGYNAGTTRMAQNCTVLGYGSNITADDGEDQIVVGVNSLASVGSGKKMTVGSGSGVDRVHLDYGTDATWTRVSDERYKENIQPNTDCGLDFINDLNPVTFTWKAKADIDSSLPDYDATKLEPTYDKKMYGMIAQEVKAAMDKHNITDFGGWNVTETDGIQGIAQGMFVHPLIKAVQELSAQVTTLQQEINTLKGE
jgi:hypothetical protein